MLRLWLDMDMLACINGAARPLVKAQLNRFGRVAVKCAGEETVTIEIFKHTKHYTQRLVK